MPDDIAGSTPDVIRRIEKYFENVDKEKMLMGAIVPRMTPLTKKPNIVPGSRKGGGKMSLNGIHAMAPTPAVKPMREPREKLNEKESVLSTWYDRLV